MNRINDMDATLGSYNNRNIYVDWFDVLDILSVWIQHQFVCEGRSNSDIFHEEDFDLSIEQDYNNDDSLQKKTKIAYNTFYPSIETVYLEDKAMQLKGKPDYKDFDKLCFYNDPRAQMDNGVKCSVTNIIEILRDIKWYNS